MLSKFLSISPSLFHEGSVAVAISSSILLGTVVDAWREKHNLMGYGWMACHFMAFWTVHEFHSYQDNGRVIMEGCVQWNPFTVERILPQARLEPKTATSTGQHFTHWASRAPMDQGIKICNIRRGNRDNLRIISIYGQKPNALQPPLQTGLDKTVLKRGFNACFRWEIKNIIPELSLKFNLNWSSILACRDHEGSDQTLGSCRSNFQTTPLLFLWPTTRLPWDLECPSPPFFKVLHTNLSCI